MPVGSDWGSRGGFSSRPHPRKPNLYFQRMSHRQQRNDTPVTFYHCSQESAKISDEMERRARLAIEQKRRADAIRLRNLGASENIKLLQLPPLNRDVTLTIEVPWSDHAAIVGLIGPWCGNESIPKIMRDTGVRILFPDLVPDAPDYLDFINRVKVTGSLVNVEKARLRIRSFAPVTIIFPLDGVKPEISKGSVKDFLEAAIADKRIDFPFLEIGVLQGSRSEQNPTAVKPTCAVRGSASREEEICAACVALHKLLFDATSESEHDKAEFYSSSVDIPLLQQLSVSGFPDGFLMRLISMKLNVAIQYPTPGDRHFGATIYYFTGSVRSVLRARKYIQGLLPIQLSFDVDGHELINPPELPSRDCMYRNRDLNVDVFITRWRIEEGEQLADDSPVRHHVVIQCGEYNLSNAYIMRHELLKPGVDRSPVVVSNDYDFFDEEFRREIANNNDYISEGLPRSADKMDSLKADAMTMQLSASAPFCPSRPPPPLPATVKKVNPTPQCEVDRLNGLHFLTAGSSPQRFQQSQLGEGREDSRRASQRAASLPSLNIQQMLSSSVPGAFSRTSSSSKEECCIKMNSETSLKEIRLLSGGIDSEKRSDTSIEQPVKNQSNEVKGILNDERQLVRSLLPQQPLNTYQYGGVVDGLFHERAIFPPRWSAGVAVAAAMLKNSPPQWFQSTGAVTALKTGENYGRMPYFFDERLSVEAHQKSRNDSQVPVPKPSRRRDANLDCPMNRRHDGHPVNRRDDGRIFEKKKLSLKPEFQHDEFLSDQNKARLQAPDGGNFDAPLDARVSSGPQSTQIVGRCVTGSFFRSHASPARLLRCSVDEYHGESRDGRIPERYSLQGEQRSDKDAFGWTVSARRSYASTQPPVLERFPLQRDNFYQKDASPSRPRYIGYWPDSIRGGNSSRGRGGRLPGREVTQTLKDMDGAASSQTSVKQKDGSRSSAEISLAKNQEAKKDGVPNAADSGSALEIGSVKESKKTCSSNVAQLISDNRSCRKANSAREPNAADANLKSPTSASKTYADIAKRIDTVRHAETMHKNDKEFLNRKVLAAEAHPTKMEDTAKSEEKLPFSRSYAEMTKKSVLDEKLHASPSVQRCVPALSTKNSCVDTKVMRTARGKSEINLLAKDKTEVNVALRNEVFNVLESVGCPNLSRFFGEQKIDISSFLSLSECDLVILGVDTQPERARILEAIQKLRSSRLSQLNI